MARLFLQYRVERVLSWPEVRDAGGVAAFNKTTPVGGIDVKTSFLSTVSAGFNLVTLVGMSDKAPSSSQLGLSTSPVGTTYWSYTSFNIPDGTRIPSEYLTAGGIVPDPVIPDGTFETSTGVISIVGSGAYTQVKNNVSDSFKSLVSDVVGPQFVGSIERAISVKQTLTNFVDKSFSVINAGINAASNRPSDIDKFDAAVDDYFTNTQYAFQQELAAQIRATVPAATIAEAALSVKAFGIKFPIYKLDVKLDGSELIAKYIVEGINIEATNVGTAAARNSADALSSETPRLFSGGNDVFISSRTPTSFLGPGNDVLITGVNNDVADLGSGNNFWRAGAGIDTALYTVPRERVSIQRTGQGEFDVTNISLNQTDRMKDVEILKFSNGTVYLDPPAPLSQVFRLYQAAFAREPDVSGLSNNYSLVENGLSLHDLARYFLSSREFNDRYGLNTSSDQLVRLLYGNVLGREPDVVGLQYWINKLENGSSKEDILLGFSESTENVQIVSVKINNGIFLDTIF